MNAQLTLLAARRARLVAEATEQRRMLVEELAHWAAPLRGIERALVRVAWAREHLHWLIAFSAAIAVSPTVRGWLRRGWHLWRAVRGSRAHRKQ
jgi:YqjK-like protein